MKRLITTFSLVLVYSSLAVAQNFSGTYVLESGEGDTVLTVQQDSQGKVRGTLELDDGTTFQLAGEIKNNEAIGIATVQDKSSLFKLRFQGGLLIYTIMAVTAENKPDMQNAQEFPFVRHGDAPGPAGGGFPSGGNPLGTAALAGGGGNPLGGGGAVSDPFVGTFADERLTLRLSAGGGNYTGQIQFQGQTFPVSARSPDGRSLSGTFSSGGSSFQFDAMLQGPTLALTTSGTTYNLRRGGGQQAAPPMPANPLGGQAPAAAQGAGGSINDPYMGVSFDPPQGWKYEKRQAIYVMGHMTLPGMILVMPHSYNSAQEVMAAANEPLYQGQDGQLMLTRAPQAVSQNMLVSDFGGVLQGQQAQGRIICMLSPHGGGVMILAGAAAGSYTQQHASLAEGIARSMRFSKPQAPPEAEMWKQRLAGSRLAYMKSGGSTDSSGGYAWSDQHDIYLCSDGSFQASGGFSGSLGTAGGSAILNPGNQTKVGQWAIVGHGGVPALQLRHQDGDVQTWVLSRDGSKTLLDGVQYFVVENPVCR